MMLNMNLENVPLVRDAQWKLYDGCCLVTARVTAQGQTWDVSALWNPHEHTWSEEKIVNAHTCSELWKCRLHDDVMQRLEMEVIHKSGLVPAHPKKLK